MKVIIPARFGSTRLLGKPLLDICGKPMIAHVWQRAVQATSPDHTYVATDDTRIYDVVSAFGGQAIMTSKDCASGTDRLVEVVDALDLGPDEIIVNVQGDEPLIPSALIQQVGQALSHTNAGIATAAAPMQGQEDIHNPNVVKVVLRRDGKASYFSRAAIPFRRTETSEKQPDPNTYLRHIGIYAYRTKTIRAFTAFPPAPTEKLEALEQLRALYNGIDIHVEVLGAAPPHGVDTPNDLETVRKIILAEKIMSEQDGA